MQSITELAAARLAAYRIVNDENTDEAVAENYMGKGLAMEKAILSVPLKTRADKLTARGILYEDGPVEFGDRFKEQLTLRLLDAI